MEKPNFEEFQAKLIKKRWEEMMANGEDLACLQEQLLDFSQRVEGYLRGCTKNQILQDGILSYVLIRLERIEKHLELVPLMPPEKLIEAMKKEGYQPPERDN